jgi:hypothetical protein
MKNQETQQTLVSKKIADTLELLEMAGYNQKHVDVIRKAMWSIYDYSILTKVGSNDKSNNQHS